MNVKLSVTIASIAILLILMTQIVNGSTSDKDTVKMKPTPIDSTLYKPKKTSWKHPPEKILNTDVEPCEEVLNSHINTAINCSFTDAIEIPQIAKYFSEKNENQPQWKYAFPAKNQKVVFHNVNGYLYVFNVEDERTLYSDQNWTGSYYYDNPFAKIWYFLVTYKQREIPTMLPEYTLKVLPLWEKTWIKENNVSQEYFDTHIHVLRVTFGFWDKGTINDNFTAYIEYYFSAGWAKIKLNDQFVLEEKEHHFLGTKQTRITGLYPMENVIPIDEVLDIVHSVSDTIHMNLNHLIIDRADNEKLKAYFSAHIDFKNNRQWRGKIDLETGDLDLNKESCIWTEY